MGDDKPVSVKLEEGSIERLFEEGKEERQQRPAKVFKKRNGVRPFPPALIAKVAREGKELAKTKGRRETTRILCQKYALAKLSHTSVDR